VRRLVLELEDDEYKRIEVAAFGHPTPDYIRAVLAAVLDYRVEEATEDYSDSASRTTRGRESAKRPPT
jgi:hypothetical protein